MRAADERSAACSCLVVQLGFLARQKRQMNDPNNSILTVVVVYCRRVWSRRRRRRLCFAPNPCASAAARCRSSRLSHASARRRRCAARRHVNH